MKKLFIIATILVTYLLIFFNLVVNFSLWFLIKVLDYIEDQTINLFFYLEDFMEDLHKEIGIEYKRFVTLDDEEDPPAEM